ncbi:LRAT domain [Dillenia turbinata]|uniref:LRAT domain n=1 Tax=Dillenia turbinata TaxID=194707 RepID=A0AAN8ZLY5_9MAGN
MPGLEEVDVQAMCYGSIFSFTPEKRKDDVKKDDGKKSWEYKLQPRLIFASRMPGPEEVDMLTFDYIGFWRKAWKAFVSEHLKASVGHIKTFRDTLESGDHIYRFGQEKIHTHHGIYIGEDMVIHYTRTEEGEKESSSSKTCPVCQYRSDLHRGVIKTCLDCFLAGQDQIYWYAYGISRSVASSFPVGSYSTRQSRPSSEVVDCASQILESGVKDYNLFFNNCEDFAHFCKTRDPKSSQTDNVRNSLWSFTQNIIKLATEMGYFGLGGPANMKAIFLVLLPFLLIVVSLIVSIGVPMLLGA